MDRILIRDLCTRCIIGVNAEERRDKQDIIINIVLWVDLRQAGRSDCLQDTIDYSALKKSMVALADSSAFYLVEALAERIAALCLADARVRRARVTVEKPTALRFARSVGVELTRTNSLPIQQYAPARACIGLGANLDAEANIRRALALLAARVELTGLSTFYRTAPIGRPEQPAFINGVAVVRTSIPPRTLKFVLLRGIEQDLGRVRGEDKNAPRPIDLDLLLYDDMAIVEEGLQLPDPEIARRPFLAIPLFELLGGGRLPGGGEELPELAAGLPREGMTPLPALTQSLQKEFLHES